MLNSSLYFFFISPSLKSMLNIFAHQFFIGEDRQRFLECYESVLTQPFKHLLFDARVTTPNQFRLLTDFVPNADNVGPVFFVPRKKNVLGQRK